MKISYPAQKIGSALYTLMTYTAGTLRERLHRVEQMGTLSAVFAQDFPPVMRGDWHRIMGALYPTEANLVAMRREQMSGEFIEEDERTPAEIDKDRLEEWVLALLTFYEEFQTYDPEGFRERRERGLLG
jgi:hypothetical protein